jgi:thioredoxin reductase (NADPH)
MDGEFDIVVVGGGIAGLTAGLGAARLGRKTLVLAGDVLGGLLLSVEKIEGVPGFPDGVPGYDLCPMAQEQATAAGAQVVAAQLDGLAPANGRWQLSTGEGETTAGAVILATGAQLRLLGLPAEQRLLGKGVSQCASCDAPLLRKRTVAVVGGGDSALQEALTLAEHAERVIVLHRGKALSAQAAYVDRVRAHPRIELRFATVVDDVLGDDRLTGVRIRDLDSDATAVLDAAALFVYIGLEPATTYLRGQLALDPWGRIPTDAGMRTELRGILAAGIVRSGSPGRAVGAAGEGVTAAVAADAYLSRGEW